MSVARAVIAEDEAVLAQMLGSALQRLWPELQLCAVAGNGFDAVEQALVLLPDVLFLDIKMPGKNGLEAAEELADEWPEGKPFPLLVFVSAYDEFALRAFEQAAVDYVLKPVSDARLAKTVERLKARLAQGRGGELERIVKGLRLLMPSDNALPSAPLNLIRAAIGNQVRMIPVEEVIYFEASDKYVRVVTAQGESLIRMPLKELLPQLDGRRFARIHRGIVVNLGHVLAAARDDAGKLSLRLRNRAETLPVSRVFAHLFKPM